MVQQALELGWLPWTTTALQPMPVDTSTPLTAFLRTASTNSAADSADPRSAVLDGPGAGACCAAPGRAADARTVAARGRAAEARTAASRCAWGCWTAFRGPAAVVWAATASRSAVDRRDWRPFGGHGWAAAADVDVLDAAMLLCQQPAAASDPAPTIHSEKLQVAGTLDQPSHGEAFIYLGVFDA